MSKRLFAGVALAVGLLLICGHSASGCDVPGHFYGHPYWPGVYGGVLPVKASSLPHFAVYPPVYYSHPVARTYGTCPFAQLPGVTNGGYIGPGTVLVDPSQPKANPAAPPAAKPLVIVNPFAASPQ